MEHTLTTDNTFGSEYSPGSAASDPRNLELVLIERTMGTTLRICEDVLVLGLNFVMPRFFKLFGQFTQQTQITAGLGSHISMVTMGGVKNAEPDRIEISGHEIFKLAADTECSIYAASTNVAVFYIVEYLFDSFKKRISIPRGNKALSELEKAAKAEMRQDILGVLRIEDLSEKLIENAARRQ